MRKACAGQGCEKARQQPTAIDLTAHASLSPPIAGRPILSRPGEFPFIGRSTFMWLGILFAVLLLLDRRQDATSQLPAVWPVRFTFIIGLTLRIDLRARVRIPAGVWPPFH